MNSPTSNLHTQCNERCFLNRNCPDNCSQYDPSAGRANDKRVGLRKGLFTRLPPVLAVYLKRSKYINMNPERQLVLPDVKCLQECDVTEGLVKITRNVTWAPTDANAPALSLHSTTQKQVDYDLCAMICHYGPSGAGHCKSQAMTQRAIEPKLTLTLC